jgi:UDP-glucose 4-epimerase
MTRFMMTLDDAVELVLYAFKHGSAGEIFVQKSPAATIEVLTKTLIELFELKNKKITIIGTRHGEKKHETLLSREEMSIAQSEKSYFRVRPDFRSLDYEKFTEKGNSNLSSIQDFNSDNTFRLDIKSTKKLLLKLPFILSSMKKNIALD